MKDKVVVITGGSSGIGKALAFEFGEKGSKIVFTGRDQQRVHEVEGSLKASGVEVLGLVSDAADEEGNRAMVEAAVATFGKIDILICNAGISMRAIFEEVDLHVFKKVMDINFYGTVYATKYALPHIIEQKGSIIGVSSINGHRGTPARSAYTASKFAMQGFFEAVRTEVMRKGVHVLVACPGFTSSNIRNVALTASGEAQGESPRDESKMMTSAQVASAIYKATRKRKRDLILTTQGKLAVFLNKFIPKKMDEIVYNVMAKEPDSPFS